LPSPVAGIEDLAEHLDRLGAADLADRGDRRVPRGLGPAGRAIRSTGSATSPPSPGLSAALVS